MGKKRIKTIQADKLKQRKTKKISRKISQGRIYIKSSYNNTMITITDLNGDVVAWSSAGLLGFKGAKKATPYAASAIMKDVVSRAKESGLREVELYVKGFGTGRESAIRAVPANGLEIVSIKDMTPVPHGGCRPPKPRRV
ncbi:MAG: 30S ribosomal protein S11 [bacterium]